MSKRLETPHDAFMNAELVRGLFIYDPETGLFTHRVPRGGLKAGSSAGFHGTDGRIYMRFDNRKFNAARLAWLYMTGEWPVEIDHRNRIADDNRFDNLRDADRSLNNSNRTGWAAREEKAVYA